MLWQTLGLRGIWLVIFAESLGATQDIFFSCFFFLVWCPNLGPSTWKKGARVIDLKLFGSDVSISTYIRNEDGTIEKSYKKKEKNYKVKARRNLSRFLKQ